MKCSKEYDVIVKNSEIIKAAIYDVLKRYESLKKVKQMINIKNGRIENILLL